MGFLPLVNEAASCSSLRATKPAKELIAQNPPQDGLQTQATSGLVFAKQAAAADVAGGDSRWQQAGNSSKQAGLVTRRGA